MLLRTIFWKEWRDQAAILIALLTIGSGLIVAIATIGDRVSERGTDEFRAYIEAPRMAALMLSLTAGVVIGGALFAGERESGTFEFLEMQPRNRSQIWFAKVMSGAILALIAGLVLGVAAGASGAFGTRGVVGWVLWNVMITFLAFGWGTLGSSWRSSSTLEACGIGILFSMMMLLVLMLVVAVVSTLRRFYLAPYYVDSGLSIQSIVFLSVLAFSSMLVAPIVLSRLVFQAPDRARWYYEPVTLATIESPRDPTERRFRIPRIAFVDSLLAVGWLTFRQTRWFALIGLAVTVIASLVFLLDPLPLLLTYPAGSLLIGVYVSVMIWSDEQSRESYRFWGERQLPPRRLWFFKVTTSFALAFLLSFLLTVPSLIRASASMSHAPTIPSMFRSGLAMMMDPFMIIYYLLLWPYYGFAFGNLAGMLFRKTIVSLGVGALLAGPLALLWAPSLISGGLHYWQWVIPPLFSLLATFLLLRTWTADRIGSRGSITILILMALLVTGSMVGGMIYRFQALPVVPEIDDDLKFQDTVPQLDSEDSGREMRRALSQFRDPGIPIPAMTAGPLTLNTASAVEKLPTTQDFVLAAFEKGWPKDRPEWDTWMNAVSRLGHEEILLEARNLPPGPLNNPRGMYMPMHINPQPSIDLIATLTVLRGLQKQAQGDATAFVPRFDAALAFTRNDRTQEPTIECVRASMLERSLYKGMYRYLEAGAPRQSLLELLAVLKKHEVDCPRDFTVPFLTDRMILRNAVTAPSQWATAMFSQLIADSGLPAHSNLVQTRSEMETTLLSFAWTVPWEKERVRRVVGLGNALVRLSDLRTATQSMLYFNFAGNAGHHYNPGTEYKLSMCDCRAAMIAVALQLYRLDQKQFPESLDALVPKYLDAIPDDPLSTKKAPFKYRLSTDEWLAWYLKPANSRQYSPPIPGLDPETAIAASAVIGGCVCHVNPPLPAPGADLPQHEISFSMMGGAPGGPAMGPGGPLLPEEQAINQIATLESISAVTGGLICWPIRVSMPNDRQMLHVPRGWGILWSVDLDGADDGGNSQLIFNGGFLVPGQAGDRIYVIPPPGSRAVPANED